MDYETKQKLKLVLLSILGLVLFFGIWECSVRFGLVSERTLCAPSTALETLFTKMVEKKPDGATIPVHFLASIKLSLSGFLLAIVIGIPLGLFMGYYKVLDSLFTPLFEIIRPIPPIAWIPIIILTMGIGFNAKVFIIFVSAFVPCVVNSYLGIKLTNQTLINVAKNVRRLAMAGVHKGMHPLVHEHGVHGHTHIARKLLVHAGRGGNARLHAGPRLYDPDRPLA